jgi:hypothetical protein
MLDENSDMNDTPSIEEICKRGHEETKRRFNQVKAQDYVHFLADELTYYEFAKIASTEIVELSDSSDESDMEQGQSKERKKRDDRNIPIGFVNDNGEIKPNLNPDYLNGAIGYMDIQNALERIKNGESYMSVSRSSPLTLRTLSELDDGQELMYSKDPYQIDLSQFL